MKLVIQRLVENTKVGNLPYLVKTSHMTNVKKAPETKEKWEQLISTLIKKREGSMVGGMYRVFLYAEGRFQKEIYKDNISAYKLSK